QRAAGELRPVPGVIERQRAGQRERERAEAPAGGKLGHVGQRLRQTEPARQELAFLLHENDDTDRGAQRLRSQLGCPVENPADRRLHRSDPPQCGQTGWVAQDPREAVGHGYGMYRIEHCLCPEQLGLRHKYLSQMWALAPQLTEDDGTGAVEQDAMLGVPLDGSGESEALDVTSDRGKLLRLVTMV